MGAITNKRHWLKSKLAGFSGGYLLLPALALGIGISIVTMSVFQALAQNSQIISNHTYKAVANEAAKSGIVAAKNCLYAYTSTTWPVTSSRCNNSTQKVVSATDGDGTYESTFSVADPGNPASAATIGTSGVKGISLTATGTVTITDASGIKTTVTDTVRAFVQTTYGTSLNVTQVSTGPNTTCVIATNNDVAQTNGWPYCWGENEFGQLGIGKYLGQPGTLSHSNIPLAVSNVNAPASAGYEVTHRHCTFLVSPHGDCPWPGTWEDVVDYSVPATQAATNDMINKAATKVSVGTDHVCAIARNNVPNNAKTATLYCWGNNDYGQLGNSSTTRYLVPKKIDSGALSSKVVLDVSAGRYFTCAKYTDSASVASSMKPADAANLDGDIACWGNNAKGQLGDGSKTNRGTPTQINMTALSALSGKKVKVLAKVHGGETMCVTDTSDYAYCWGANFAGQVGDRTKANDASIYDARCDNGPYIATYNDRPYPTAVSDSPKQRYSSFSIYGTDNGGYVTGVTTAASPTPNRAFTWGGYVTVSSCRLRNVDTNYYTTFPAVAPTSGPTGTIAPIGSSPLTSAVSGNAYNGPFCSFVGGSNLYCVRHSTTASALNVGNISSRQIVDMDTATISNDYATVDHSCIVTNTGPTDGTVYCWGKNDKGQLGDRSSTQRSVPTAVDTFTSTDASITNSGLGVTNGTISFGEPVYY